MRRESWPSKPRPLLSYRSGTQMYDDATRAEAAEHHAADMYHLWTEDREKLKRWRVLAVFQTLLIIAAVAGLLWGKLT